MYIKYLPIVFNCYKKKTYKSEAITRLHAVVLVKQKLILNCIFVTYKKKKLFYLIQLSTYFKNRNCHLNEN